MRNKVLRSSSNSENKHKPGEKSLSILVPIPAVGTPTQDVHRHALLVGWGGW